MTDDAEETPPPSSVARLYQGVRKVVFIFGVLFIMWVLAVRIFPNLLAHKPAERPALHETHVPAKTESPAAAESSAPPSQPSAPEVTQAQEEPVDALDKRVGELESQLRASTAMPAEPQASTKETLELLNAQKEHIAQLDAMLQEQQRLLQELKAQMSNAQATSTNRLSALTLMGALKESAGKGEPYAATLAQIQQIMAGNGSVSEAAAQLKPHADKGAPTLGGLKDEFARALPQALAPAAQENTLTRNLQSLIRIRKVGANQSGADDEAVLARAEAKLSAGDVDAALKETASLSPAATAMFATWNAHAQDYLKLQGALGALQAALVSDAPLAASIPAPAAPAPAPESTAPAMDSPTPDSPRNSTAPGA